MPAEPPAVMVARDYAEIDAMVFKTSCNFSVCHTAGPRAQGGLDLVTDSYAALFNVAAQNPKANGEQRVLVKPCDPENSFLLTKLKLPADGDPKLGYGARMPQNSPALPAEQLLAIADWIARGAHRQEPPGTSGSICTER